ncbi:MAG: imidazoleglycerol-phosphate dehydratase HisB [Bacillota bacterium]
MYKVVVDKKFFNFDSELSDGLISGLKSLTAKGFQIAIDDQLSSSSLTDKIINKILLSESISLSKKNTGSRQVERSYTVLSGKKASEVSGNADLNTDIIIVNKNGQINNFGNAAAYILGSLRTASKQRDTRETKIKVDLMLDGQGISEINTGVGFFDHMLEQIAKHSNLNLKVKVDGDLHVDEHHTVEDTGITLGAAINEALGDKRGIKRYGFVLPMDESVAKCAIDLGGRSLLNFKCKFKREKVGDFPTELTEEFFRGLASGLKANIYLRARGKNDHHKIEAMFKAFAKALNEALRMDERNQNTLPSTKGIL